jgi:hypothetical protein
MGDPELARFTKVQRLTLPHLEYLRTPFYTGHDPEHDKMFWKEVQLLRNLRHPHIATGGLHKHINPENILMKDNAVFLSGFQFLWRD